MTMMLQVFRVTVAVALSFALHITTLTDDTCSATMRSKCPPNWKHRENFCYKIAPERLSFFGAHDSCIKLGGSLAAPESREEIDFIYGLMSDDEVNEVWVNCDKFSGSWECEGEGKTRAPIPRALWDTSGQPSNGPNEHCVLMSDRWGSGNGLHDVVCTQFVLPAICKKQKARLHV